MSRCFGARMDHFVTQAFPNLFETQVANRPEQPAVVSGDNSLSYAELNARANQLAEYLRAHGAGAETLVGICIDRSLDMAIGILGILKSGAAYLPLDPDYPAERLAWLVKDSQVSLLLTTSNLAVRFPDSAAKIILLDQEKTQICKQSSANPEAGPKADDLAYVIYTSGSTGEPKGVMINHESLANYVVALDQELEISENDRYLHTASISFSSSRRQLLLPLSRGATVVIASSEQRKDPLALFQLIKRSGITVMDAVPSFWRNCTAVLSSLDREARTLLLDNELRLMLSASEPMLSDVPHTWINEFRHPARHVHMFGQTETAGIVCVYKDFETNNKGSGIASVVPVGRPIANTEIYILDEAQTPVPVGMPGELYIGGAGVGRGYLNRPDLTAEKFLDHPFCDLPGARLYRTGDWARLRADGQIEFAGRRDSQVKVRGFRIELGEVEATLARHEGVRENAVVARPDSTGTLRLLAYFVAFTNALNTTDLRTFMSARLPDYMVPSAFIQLEALPLNANGKVDRRALPQPEELRPELATPYEAPRTATEELLAEIWTAVLRVEQIGINDDFFELGGHSLLATQVVARVNSEFQITVPLRVLFDSPTICGLGKQIEALQAGEAPSNPGLALTKSHRATRDQQIPLSFAQQRLWFIDQLEPGSSLYNINRALRLHGQLDAVKLERAIQLIAARHEILRTKFVAQDGRPVQQVSPSVVLPFNYQDLRSTPQASRDNEARQILRIETEKPFDLARGPLARVTLLRTADEEYLLLLSIHHIIADAWAIRIFLKELAAFCQDAADEASLPGLPGQYADFANWQRNTQAGDALNHQLAYWRRQLEGAQLLDLPTDYPRPAVSTSQGGQRTISLSQTLSQSLRDLGRAEGATLFMTLLAAFQILMALYSGQDDISVGIPVAGRTLVETEALIGCFINTLVLRVDLSANPSLRKVIRRTRELALGAYANQDVPFERLVEELRPERSLNRTPLFQVMFVLQDETQPELTLEGVSAVALPLEVSKSKFDLSLVVVEKPEGLDLSLSYSTELFDSSSINTMLEDFKCILESLAANPGQHLADLPHLRWQPRVLSSEKTTEVERDNASTTAIPFLTPRTPIEERLAEIWSEILGTENLSVHDNFFELGGHSLLAAQVISRARNSFSVELPLRRIFETPTVAGLAATIYETQAAETGDEELAAMLAELGELSDEEAQRQFAEEV